MKRFISLAALLIFLTSCNLPALATNTSIPTAPPRAALTNPPAPASSPTAIFKTPPGKANTPMLPASPTAEPTTRRGKPNIILILADDLDASAIQYMPKLKSLIADQGETFTNYFVSESLCCPSRATTLRGQYPHNAEIVSNHMPTGGFRKFYQLGEEKSTIAIWLQEAGYRTMLAGKYLNGYPLKTDLFYIPPG